MEIQKRAIEVAAPVIVPRHSGLRWRVAIDSSGRDGGNSR